MGDARGQALVETALVLPVLGLGVAAAVLLICYAHNVISLQLMAAKAARRMTVESSFLSPVAVNPPLWGRLSPTVQRPMAQELEPWRQFQGAAIAPTMQTPGRLISIQIQNRLLPGRGFSRNLRSVSELAAAETFLEPPVPPEE